MVINKFPAQLAAAIRKLMADNGISEKSLSDATKIPRSTLGRRLTGQAFTANEMEAISKHFGMTVTDLCQAAETIEVTAA